MLKDKPDTKSARHFALRVDDVGKAREYFKGLGMEVMETTEIPGAIDPSLEYDPDGNRIESSSGCAYDSDENAPR